MAYPVAESDQWSLEQLVYAFDFLDDAPPDICELINGFKDQIEIEEARVAHGHRYADVLKEIRSRADLERQTDFGTLLVPVILLRSLEAMGEIDVVKPRKKTVMSDEEADKTAELVCGMARDGLYIRDFNFCGSWDAVFINLHMETRNVLGVRLRVFDYLYE